MPMTPIVFSDTTSMLPGEVYGKYLDPCSALVTLLEFKRRALSAKYGAAADVTWPWYIQLFDPTSNVERDDAARYVLHRAGNLHGKVVDTSNVGSFQLIGNAYVLSCPTVPEYGPTHVILATFTEVPLMVTI